MVSNRIGLPQPQFETITQQMAVVIYGLLTIDWSAIDYGLLTGTFQTPPHKRKLGRSAAYDTVGLY